jgi:hypothetical protein
VFGGTFNAATGAVSGVSTMTGISRRRSSGSIWMWG